VAVTYTLESIVTVSALIPAKTVIALKFVVKKLVPVKMIDDPV
jgi:hypothetical protein